MFRQHPAARIYVPHTYRITELPVFGCLLRENMQPIHYNEWTPLNNSPNGSENIYLAAAASYENTQKYFLVYLRICNKGQRLIQYAQRTHIRASRSLHSQSEPLCISSVSNRIECQVKKTNGPCIPFSP